MQGTAVSETTHTRLPFAPAVSAVPCRCACEGRTTCACCLLPAHDRPLLTWLDFVPSTGLTAAPWGAPLAGVKWFFTRAVHFVLHRLEALGRAERNKEEPKPPFSWTPHWENVQF